MPPARGSGLEGLVVFDLDGTLLRGPTVCEVLAHRLGQLPEMQRFETFTTQADIAAARREMAGWYRRAPRRELLGYLDGARWAPGALEGVRRLRDAGLHVAIASVTWDFAVRWFAERLGVEHFLGTGLDDACLEIRDVWADDKARWMASLAGRLGIPPQRIAAVGDSFGDLPMLRAAALPVFVGRNPPGGSELLLRPEADIGELAQELIDAWDG